MEFEILVSYMRACDQEHDYHKVIRVEANDQSVAESMVNDYLIQDLFDNFEDDYLEDTLHVVRTLCSHKKGE